MSTPYLSHPRTGSSGRLMFNLSRCCQTVFQRTGSIHLPFSDVQDNTAHPRQHAVCILKLSFLRCVVMSSNFHLHCPVDKNPITLSHVYWYSWIFSVVKSLFKVLLPIFLLVCIPFSYLLSGISKYIFNMNPMSDVGLENISLLLAFSLS